MISLYEPKGTQKEVKHAYQLLMLVLCYGIQEIVLM